MKDRLNIIHDTVRETKIIIDTVRTSSKDSMDLLTKIDSFYNNAWTKLIIVVTISFTIIGVLVPALIQWYQKKELKLREDTLKLEIKTEFESALKEFNNKFEENNISQLKNIKKEIHSVGLHVQAVVMNTNGDFAQAAFDYIKSSKGYLELNDVKSAKSTLTGVKNTLNKCVTKSEADKVFIKFGTSVSIDRIIEILKVADKGESLHEQIAKLKSTYDSLT